MHSFNEYLRFRGYAAPISDPRPFFARAFVTCWAEPGFHVFWRIWNPVVGFLTYRSYLLLGGKRRRSAATLAVFAACGFMIHDSFGLLFGEFTLKNTISFVLMGFLALLNRRLENVLRQDAWPAVANVLVNLGLVCGSFVTGSVMNRMLFD